MRLALGLVLLLVGCAQQSSLHASCASAGECPAGYSCRIVPATGVGTCEVLCTTSDDCSGLQQGGNEPMCTSTGQCDIRCHVAGDCPAPLHCPAGMGSCTR